MQIYTKDPKICLYVVLRHTVSHYLTPTVKVIIGQHNYRCKKNTVRPQVKLHS